MDSQPTEIFSKAIQIYKAHLTLWTLTAYA